MAVNLQNNLIGNALLYHHHVEVMLRQRPPAFILNLAIVVMFVICLLHAGVQGADDE